MSWNPGKKTKNRQAKLLNGHQALCLYCQATGAKIIPSGLIVCHHCGERGMVDRKTKQPFEEEFADD